MAEDDNSICNKKRNTSKDITADPKFKEPFRYPFWQRELVYRSNSRRTGDVYYYLTVDEQGQITKNKFRSKVEISKKCKYD